MDAVEEDDIGQDRMSRAQEPMREREPSWMAQLSETGCRKALEAGVRGELWLGPGSRETVGMRESVIACSSRQDLGWPASAFDVVYQ